MAPRASRSMRPGVLAAAGVCAACCYLLGSAAASSFASPRTLATQSARGHAFGQRQELGTLQTPRAAAGAAAARPEEAVPSVTDIAVQGMAALSAVSGVIGMVLGGQAAVQGFVGLLGLYVIMSLNEYCVHRYYQHLGLNKNQGYRWLRSTFSFLPALKSSGHVEHHKETLDDMTLDQRPHPILDDDPFRGTAFSWSVSAIMTIEIALQSYPWLWLCGWSLTASTAALFAAMLLHAAAWQTLHPAMHELPDPPVSYGVPGWSMAKLRGSTWFKFLRANHEGHHRCQGAHGNYNVCCPLADHLFGTYVGVIPAKQAA